MDADETIDLSSGDPESGQPGSVKAAAGSGVRSLDKDFGEYELIEELARGGMGVVYRARHKGLNRTVALKVILSGQFASENDVRRFQLEAGAAANLDHEGIVPIYEVGEHDGHHYFTMKLIEGGSLLSCLPEIRKDHRKMARLFSKIAAAVHHAHVRGVLHRDLKPANILIDENGEPMVSDLGLAKNIHSDSDLTGTGAVVGTPAYMSPEQASAEKEITTATDIYSIGAMLYEALTGSPPHQDSSTIKTLLKVTEGNVKSPREADKSIDRVLELICMKCLQKEPTERYASAAALAKDLDAWLAGGRVSVRPPSMASVASDIFYENLRSAFGAAAIGIIAGLVFGFGMFTLVLVQFFGEGSDFDLYALQRELPSFPRQDFYLASVPVWVYQYGNLIAIGVYLFVGLAVQRLTRPKSLREAIAISLVAGMFMTVTVFGISIANLVIGNDVLVRQANEIELLSDAAFLEGEPREKAIETLTEGYPELTDYEPNKRAELLAKSISVISAIAMAKLMWASIAFSSFLCLLPCVVGTVFAFRMQTREPRLWKTIVAQLEWMILLTLIIILLTIEVIATLEFTNGSGQTIPKLSLSRFLLLVLVIVAMIPGYRFWKWYWRWPAYVGLAFVALLLTNRF